MTNTLFPAVPNTATLPHSQPQAYRLIRVDREEIATGFRMTALLHHAGANPTVTWTTKQLPDTRLKHGVIIRLSGMRGVVADNGAIEVQRLILLERPEASLNLFETVPSCWVRDKDLLVRASCLWSGLPSHFQALFNSVFWCGERFRRYCTGPSSLRGHHACQSGNLRHSVEVAETMLHLLRLYDTADPGLSVMAGLLHDAGKADEYIQRSGGMAMSQRGKLLGHKMTVVEWLAVARSKMRMGVPEDAYLSLVHALTASVGAPEYLGLREAVTPEAMLLSQADRASGKADLLNRCLGPEGGWGQRHPHLKGTPYTLPGRSPKSGLRGMEALKRFVQANKAANG